VALVKKRRRAVIAERGCLVSACGLLGLSAFKGIAGWMTGSNALLADACHSAASGASAFTSYLTWRSARQKSSAQAAAIASIVFSAILFVAGLEMGLYCVAELIAGPDEAPGMGAAAVIAAGMLIREALMLYKRRRDSRLGIRPNQTGEHISDMFASLTALAGSLGAAAGAYLGTPTLYVLDPAAGIIVSLFVLRMGFRMIYDVFSQTKQEGPHETETQALREAVQCVEGVVEVDQIHAKEQGHYLVVTAVIRVNPRISVAEGHDIAMRVRRHLTRRFLHVSDVVVQVEPYDPGFPYKTNYRDEEWSTILQ
jgi:cation diffusion facilitator family transporter